jgi:hypothetical protein
MDRTEGGRDDRVVALSRARARPLPDDVARLLSHLANVLDDTIEVRGTGNGVRDVAADFLGVANADLVAASTHLSGLRLHLAGLALAEDLEAHPPAAEYGEGSDDPPRWERLDLGERHPRIPVSLTACWAPGTVAEVPLVVAVERDWNRGGIELTVFARRDDEGAGRSHLDDLLARGHSRPNPYRGEILEAGFQREIGLTFRVLTPTPTSRLDVVLPDELWAELDLNVHGLFAAAERLGAAGLSANRGVLLEGPPGTGKTAVCRALAAEVAGPVTVVFCDARTIAFSVRDLYRELRSLAPALVVMEDVDLVIANRGRGGGGALNDFLLALDGAMSRHRGVVTIATTNDLAAIDPAARRTARFDRVMTIGPPDRVARAAIVTRLLAGLGDDATGVDPEAVADATPGMTGADLRELVSLALLCVADAARTGAGSAALDTALLLCLARDEAAKDHPGQYL